MNFWVEQFDYTDGHWTLVLVCDSEERAKNFIKRQVNGVDILEKDFRIVDISKID